MKYYFENYQSFKKSDGEIISVGKMDNLYACEVSRNYSKLNHFSEIYMINKEMFDKFPSNADKLCNLLNSNHLVFLCSDYCLRRKTSNSFGI